MFFNKKRRLKDDESLNTDELMHEVVFQIMKERRWRTLTSLFRTLIFLLFVVMLIYFFFQNSGSKQITDTVSSSSHLAVIKINGAISSDKTANADDIYKLLEKAFKNDSAEAILLSINSPGGSPVQAGRIYDDVRHFKTLYDKPVYAYIDDIGASAGYYIAAAADKIYANRASLVGSIGVISSSFGLVDTIDGLGIERRVIKSGEHKNFLDPFSPLHEEQAAFWQTQLDITHQQFIDRVVESRGKRLNTEVEGLFSGLVWNGEEAKRIGLIDDLSSPQQLAGDNKIIEYRKKGSFLDSLDNKLPFSIHSSNLVDEVVTRLSTQKIELR